MLAVHDIVINLPDSFRIQHFTSGLGNCFFHAVMDNFNDPNRRVGFFDYHIEALHDHLSLRRSIVAYIQELERGKYSAIDTLKRTMLTVLRVDHKLPQCDHCSQLQDGEAMCDDCELLWEQELLRMNEAGSWGESFILQATAWFFNREIWVTTAENVARDENGAYIAEPWTVFYPEGRTRSDVTEQHIYMCNLGQKHFQSLARGKYIDEIRTARVSFKINYTYTFF